ncbi:hypothetical protein, partial [Streptomyces atratus]|uniref:hypothetical protein n=1 Tax=Streptomyces atratus TaxID=1893 RepID=UPI0036492E2F
MLCCLVGVALGLGRGGVGFRCPFVGFGGRLAGEGGDLLGGRGVLLRALSRWLTGGMIFGLIMVEGVVRGQYAAVVQG